MQSNWWGEKRAKLREHIKRQWISEPIAQQFIQYIFGWNDNRMRWHIALHIDNETTETQIHAMREVQRRQKERSERENKFWNRKRGDEDDKKNYGCLYVLYTNTNIRMKKYVLFIPFYFYFEFCCNVYMTHYEMVVRTKAWTQAIVCAARFGRIEKQTHTQSLGIETKEQEKKSEKKVIRNRALLLFQWCVQRHNNMEYRYKCRV